MQRVILTGMFFLFASVAVNAEVVQSVNFNPARFGQYERLKVSDKATFLGGMSAQSMRVQSAGTVTINESPSNGQGRLVYDILKLDATRGFLYNGTEFPTDPALNFPNTCFGSLENCVTSSATGNLNVSFQNGKARFQAPASYTDNASRINQITTQADQLRIEAIYATIKGKLNVTGNGTYSYRNQTADTPLRLAGNWVPLPSADGAPQNATLKWENRTTVKYADHGGETVRILVLDGGTAGGGGTTPPTTGGGTEECSYKLVKVSSQPFYITGQQGFNTVCPWVGAGTGSFNGSTVPQGYRPPGYPAGAAMCDEKCGGCMKLTDVRWYCCNAPAQCNENASYLSLTVEQYECRCV